MRKTFCIQALCLILLLTIAAQCKNLTSKAEDLLKNDQLLKTFEDGTSKNFHKEKRHQDFWQQENILQFTRENLLAFERREEIWLVLCYQPDNASKGYQNIFKVWKGVANKLDGLMKVVAVDCNETTALCERFTVSFTPRILLFEANVTAKPIIFMGYISADTIVAFASHHMPNFVKYIMDYNVFVIENFDEAKVIYVTRSDETPSLFKALSKEFQGKITFGRVPIAQTRFLQPFGITTCPALLFLQDPFAYKAVQYQGDFNKVEITNFLKAQYSSFFLASFYRRKEIWLTLFYRSSDLSKSSQNSQRVWKQVTEQLNEIVKVFAFDCDQESEKNICQEFNVNETPKILLFPVDSGTEALTFTGSIEYEQIASFALTQIKSHVQNITDNNYKSFVQQNSKTDKVLLFAQENATSLLFSALSNEFKDRMAFGEVQESNNTTALINQFQIKSFPTIYFLGPQENPHKTKYEMKFNRDELARFIRFVAQSPLFNDFQSRKEVWLIFFYKKSSLISQNEKDIWKVWKDAAEKLSGSMKVVAVDCAKGVDATFCEYSAHPAPLALPDVPSIQIFSAKTEGFQKAIYAGLIESDLIVSFAINQMESFEKIPKKTN